MDKKYTILTFIIGKNYETVHEILNKQDDIEYLLITDDSGLTSNTWTVVYDESLLNYKSAFERCFRIRYNVFKYCHTDTCVTLDGSMQVKGSLDKLIQKFNDENYDICLMPHPLWADFKTEYSAWIQMRKYPIAQANNAMKFFMQSKYDINYKGLFQLCFSIKRRSYVTKQIDDLTIACVQMLSNESLFERLDQTVFTYVMNTYFSHLKVLPVSEQVVRSYAIQWFWHHDPKDSSEPKPNNNIFYDINKPDMKYVFNKEVECYYLK